MRLSSCSLLLTVLSGFGCARPSTLNDGAVVCNGDRCDGEGAGQGPIPDEREAYVFQRDVGANYTQDESVREGVGPTPSKLFTIGRPYLSSNTIGAKTNMTAIKAACTRQITACTSEGHKHPAEQAVPRHYTNDFFSDESSKIVDITFDMTVDNARLQYQDLEYALNYIDAFLRATGYAHNITGQIFRAKPSPGENVGNYTISNALLI